MSTIVVSIRDASLGPILGVLIDDIIFLIFSFLPTPKELLNAALVSKVFYIFATEEELWRTQCLRRHGGQFTYRQSWRYTTFFPLSESPTAGGIRQFQRLSIAGFSSQFLFRKFYNSHVLLQQFAVDYGHVPRVRACDLSDERFKYDFDLPKNLLLITDGMNEWPAMNEWQLRTMALKHGDLCFKVTHPGKEKFKLKFSEFVNYACRNKRRKN
jgi:hypothetical protein